MASLLNLASLVALFLSCQNAADRIDFAKHGENRLLNLPFQEQQPRRSTEYVHHVFKDTRLLDDNGLSVRGQACVFFRGCGKWLIGGIAVTGIGVVQIRHHELDRSSSEVILKFCRDERASAGLCVKLEHLGPCVSTEDVPHADGPDPATHATENEVLDVEAAIQEK